VAEAAELSGHPTVAVQVIERIFIALHFSTSCAKCIAVVALGCLPQGLFTPHSAMLAYCSF